MASTQSIVTTLVVLVGFVQLGAAMTRVCEVCEVIPAACLGTSCPQIVPGTLASGTNTDVARKVCVQYGDIPESFTMRGCNSNTMAGEVNVFKATCPSKIYVYTVDKQGNRAVFRSGLSKGGVEQCGAQRGFCAPNNAASITVPTIDTTVQPWTIKAGTWTCKLGTGFAGNNWQLWCAL